MGLMVISVLLNFILMLMLNRGLNLREVRLIRMVLLIRMGVLSLFSLLIIS